MARKTTLTRKPARKGQAKKVAGRRKAPAKSWFPSLAFLNNIPVSEKFVDRAVTISTVALVGAGLLGLAYYSGLPGYVGTEVAKAVGRAGFEVKRVELTGLERMDRLTVYNIALDQHSMAMPLVDLDKVRDELMQFSWIADARVSRRLPDTLVVDIVERKPAAVWQHNQKLSLIDDKGVVLERVDPGAVPNLPVLVGHEANKQAVALGDLLGKVPSLKPALASATWVGDRRWDLQFNSGETLALPEGEDASGNALKRFARLDGTERLLGRGFARFDMRDPTKMVVRMSNQPRVQKKEEPAGNQKHDDQSGEIG
jgi:cell division protein FtsQ